MKIWVDSEEAYPVYYITSESKYVDCIEITQEQWDFIQKAEEDYAKAQEIMAKTPRIK